MKKFLIKISYTLLPLWLLLVGAVIYLNFVKQVTTGDLATLSQTDENNHYYDSLATFLPQHIAFNIVTSYDSLALNHCHTLVIGDSFAQGGGMGHKASFVNYLAIESRLNTSLLRPWNYSSLNPAQVAYCLLRYNYIDSTCVKHIIIEEVQRYMCQRHRAFSPNTSLVTAPPETTTKHDDFSPLMRVKDFVFHHYLDENPAKEVGLSRPMFTGNNSDVLSFYYDDIEPSNFISTDDADKIVRDYDMIFSLARDKGIGVTILIAADKYDVYQDFIVNNPYPANHSTSTLQHALGTRSAQFLLSKQILLPLVQNGTKDVYLHSDTHWSYKASKIIATSLIENHFAQLQNKL